MEGLRIAVVVSRFHEELSKKLLVTTLDALTEEGLTEDEISVVDVPGALEIPLVAKKQATFHDVVICLGAVIRGETSHCDIVCQTVANALSDVSLEFEIPIINGILTVDNMEQAEERVQRGEYFAQSALEMAALIDELEEDIELESEQLLEYLESVENSPDFEQN